MFIEQERTLQKFVSGHDIFVSSPFWLWKIIYYFLVSSIGGQEVYCIYLGQLKL